MATNHFERTRREQERILSGLERTHDKAGIPLRKYMTDMTNIQKLLSAGTIDRPHADLLAENVERVYQQYLTKGRAEKLRIELTNNASRNAIIVFLLIVAGTLIATMTVLNKLFG